MHTLLPIAEKLGALLKERKQTLSVAESSTGGLISAAMLSVPGASAYFIGGGVVYTLKSRRVILDLPDTAFAGIKSITEPLAVIMARGALARFATTWSVSEIGASGPTGSRYGDPAGHTCIAVAGPVERSLTLQTGLSDRVANMRAFSVAALNLLMMAIESA